MPDGHFGREKNVSVMTDYDAYIGLDVHEDSVSVAVAEARRLGEVCLNGTIANEADMSSNLVRKLGDRHGLVESVHQAGPCGYNVFREVVVFDLIAGSSRQVIPRAPMQWQKNDTRDAVMLARLLRAGELTCV